MSTRRASLISQEDTRSPVTEAYRTLNTNIRFSKLEHPAKTLLITSSGAAEGKSTTVANLGMAMAQAGNKVLLLDLDLRKPVLHKFFNLDNSYGLTQGIMQTYDVDLKEGDLKEFTPSDLFKIIHVQQKTGTLTVKACDHTVNLYFNSGKLVGTDSGRDSQKERLGELLVQRGLITKEQLKDCCFRQEQTSHTLESVLANSGFVNIDTLKVTAKSQLEETLRLLFSWKDGAFAFQVHDSVDYSKEMGDFTEAAKPFVEWSHQEGKYSFINSQLKSLLKNTEMENLKVVSSGSLPPNPSRLLGSQAMKEFLNDVASRFDAVLCDSPPILTASDASIIANLVDGVLMVIRPGQLTRDVIQRAKDQIEGVNARILGVILNDVDLKKDGYYYKYYYHYYNYYTQNEKEK